MLLRSLTTINYFNKRVATQHYKIYITSFHTDEPVFDTNFAITISSIMSFTGSIFQVLLTLLFTYKYI